MLTTAVTGQGQVLLDYAYDRNENCVRKSGDTLRYLYDRQGNLREEQGKGAGNNTAMTRRTPGEHAS